MTIHPYPHITLSTCPSTHSINIPPLIPHHHHHQQVLFACLVMASKVWDDLSMWNVDFSHVCPSFDLQRVNSLELTMLEELRYFIKVSAGEYAKYYFLLRSMTVKLGMGQGLGSSPGSPSGNPPRWFTNIYPHTLRTLHTLHARCRRPFHSIYSCMFTCKCTLYLSII